MLAWQTVQNSRVQRVRNIWTLSGQEHLSTFLLLMASRVEEKTGTSLRKFGFKIVLDKITNSCKSFCFRLVWETQTFDNVLSHCTHDAHIFLVSVICHGILKNISTYSCQFSPSLNGCNCLKIPAIVVQQWRSVVVVLKSKKQQLLLRGWSFNSSNKLVLQSQWWWRPITFSHLGFLAWHLNFKDYGCSEAFQLN